jgi:neutral amino acid transport system ATP-binding protein
MTLNPTCGGEQKMADIGRALIAEPALYLLDEPSSALSPKLIDQVFGKVAEINVIRTDIMMEEQNAKKALAISDRGYVLGMGKNRNDGRGRKRPSRRKPTERGLYLGA